MAKFEVCCHRWADLSEHGYGVSILNDSKYGFATCGNVMRLSLLRSPKAPDAHADMGTHHIRYALYPHAGPLGPDTVRAACAFNSPLRLVSSPGAYDKLFAAEPAPVELSGDPALVLDTVKRGEDDDDVSRGDLPAKKGRRVVLRIYDSMGGTAKGRVKTRWDVKKVAKANLLEDEEDDVPLNDDASFDLTLRPFEVATFVLTLA